MSLGGRLTVSDAVSCPLLPELNVPVAIRGLGMVVSFYVNAGTAARSSAISARTAIMPIFLIIRVFLSFCGWPLAVSLRTGLSDIPP
jgi:hypothetical protein